MFLCPSFEWAEEVRGIFFTDAREHRITITLATGYKGMHYHFQIFGREKSLIFEWL